MYKIKLETVDYLTHIKLIAYSELLGLTSSALSLLFNGKATTKLSTAKAILSVAYNLPVTDFKMQELLDRHFVKIN